VAEGDYRLVFLDDQRREVHSRAYRVRDDLNTNVTQLTSGRDVDAGELVTATVIPHDNTHTLVLENKSPYYLQANTSRDQVYLKSARYHAGSLRTSAGSLVVRVSHALKPEEGGRDQSLILLPCDLPPGGRIELTLPGLLNSTDDMARAIQWKPHFLRPGEQTGTRSEPPVEIVQGNSASRR
jgi:hypothetical protein